MKYWVYVGIITNNNISLFNLPNKTQELGFSFMSLTGIFFGCSWYLYNTNCFPNLGFGDFFPVSSRLRLFTDLGGPQYWVEGGRLQAMEEASLDHLDKHGRNGPLSHICHTKF